MWRSPRLHCSSCWPPPRSPLLPPRLWRRRTQPRLTGRCEGSSAPRPPLLATDLCAPSLAPGMGTFGHPTPEWPRPAAEPGPGVSSSCCALRRRSLSPPYPCLHAAAGLHIMPPGTSAGAAPRPLTASRAVRGVLGPTRSPRPVAVRVHGIGMTAEALDPCDGRQMALSLASRSFARPPPAAGESRRLAPTGSPYAVPSSSGREDAG